MNMTLTLNMGVENHVDFVTKKQRCQVSNLEANLFVLLNLFYSYHSFFSCETRAKIGPKRPLLVLSRIHLFIKCVILIFIVNTVGKVKCKHPTDIDDAKPTSSLKRVYYVGQNVTYQCNGGPEKEVRQCLSDGTWSGGNFVCGRK